MKINQSKISLSLIANLFFMVSFIFTLFSSCMGDGMSDEYKEYLAIHPSPEISNVEWAFIDSLDSVGFKHVFISLPYAWDNNHIYSLSFEPPYKLTKNNLDSVRADVLNITKELFSKKVSNNILYDTHAIWVTPWIESDSIKKTVRYVELELVAKDFYRELGFKVVMNKDSTFSKVYFDSLK